MSWQQLLDIIHEARANSSQPEQLTECPKCGTPLEQTPRGLHCPFGDWTGA